MQSAAHRHFFEHNPLLICDLDNARAREMTAATISANPFDRRRSGLGARCSNVRKVYSLLV
jgi:hypothetical protein